jgi:cbb3-type cytochrome oxidase subunit 3
MPEKELISEEVIELIFKYLAILLPLLGLFLGAIFSAFKKRLTPLWWGIGLGVIGSFNLLLWRIYSLILDKLGFDSVKAFLFNVFLFIAIGVFLGYLLAYILRPHKKEV